MKNSASSKEFLLIVKKYLQRKASQQEKAFLEKYYGYFEKEPGIIDQLSDTDKERLRNELLEGTLKKAGKEPKKILILRSTWLRAAAAVFLLMLGAGSFYLYMNGPHVQVAGNSLKVLHKTDALPGGNKAMLVLADGSYIVLDSAKNGILARQANTTVLKLDNGQLAYSSANAKKSEVLYNSITTPRGGQYRLVLPDKSTVFLNSVSSIRFPVEFTGAERKVEITGEAYFEVSRDPGKPFRVLVKNQVSGKVSEVEVIGTHFNINAYSDLPVSRTTLLEGSVRFSNGNEQVVLSPGEQLQLNQNDVISVQKNVNVENEIAWTKGMFIFNHADIQEIMRQISNWYDVDVTFQGNIISTTFSGVVSRKSNVSEVLKIMERAGINFAIEGKKITVSQ